MLEDASGTVYTASVGNQQNNMATNESTKRLKQYNTGEKDADGTNTQSAHSSMAHSFSSSASSLVSHNSGVPRDDSLLDRRMSKAKKNVEQKKTNCSKILPYYVVFPKKKEIAYLF